MLENQYFYIENRKESERKRAELQLRYLPQ